MKKLQFDISQQSIDYYFNSDFSHLADVVNPQKSIIVTDSNIYKIHRDLFDSWSCVVIDAGEKNKNLSTTQYIIDELIKKEADRSTTLIGVGGGVVTDITGFVASIYMRGISFGYVPTTLLNMVDSSLGGKNGVDFGSYKNMLGRISQPAFILQDLKFLHTLPQPEWQNGYSEMIKHACILDKDMFQELQMNNIDFYIDNEDKLNDIISRNIKLKLDIVQRDTYESGDRMLLNFGHTIGHALETAYDLSHGQAISIGMALATKLSERLTGFSEHDNLIQTLNNYGLPHAFPYNTERIFDILKMDKKRKDEQIRFVLLESIGHGIIQPISLSTIHEFLKEFERENL